MTKEQAEQEPVCIDWDTKTEIAKLIEAAVLAEREACAKVCGQLMTPWDENTPNGELIALRNDGMRQCAAAIRARSN